MDQLLQMAIPLLLVAAVVLFFIKKNDNKMIQTESSTTTVRADGMSTKTTVDGKRSYTSEEVAKHVTEDDVWLIINKRVYNFTDYVALHPGGEALLRNAGQDSTEGFSGSQHPPRVWDMIDEFCIGDLVGEEKEESSDNSNTKKQN